MVEGHHDVRPFLTESSINTEQKSLSVASYALLLCHGFAIATVMVDCGHRL